MANRYKSFVDFLVDLKAILSIPSGDSSENVTLLAFFQNAAVNQAVAKRIFNDQYVSTGSVAAASSFSVSLAIVAIDALEVTYSSHTYPLKPRSAVVGLPPVAGGPTAYAVQAANPSSGSAATISSTFHLFPSANYTLDYRLVYRGIYIPSSINDNSLLAYETIYQDIVDEVVKRMQVKRGAIE